MFEARLAGWRAGERAGGRAGGWAHCGGLAVGSTAVGPTASGETEDGRGGAHGARYTRAGEQLLNASFACALVIKRGRDGERGSGSTRVYGINDQGAKARKIVCGDSLCVMRISIASKECLRFMLAHTLILWRFATRARRGNQAVSGNARGARRRVRERPIERMTRGVWSVSPL